MTASFQVGDIVKSEARPDWGEGQVQSNINGRLTVNFKHAGKLVLSGAEARLVLVQPDWN